jgi:5-methylcytosine-specific restriction endonuclease McrA
MNGIAFPKPQTRKVERAKKRRQERQWISAVRGEVFKRDSKCRSCGIVAGVHHLHEIVYRSRTRGQPIKSRISTNNCIRLCLECHQAIHLSRLTVVVHDKDLGANGIVDFDRVGWSV